MSRRSKGKKYREMFIRFLNGLKGDDSGIYTVINLETGFNEPYQRGKEIRQTILAEGRVPFLKIQFIKNLRQITGCGLLEAKKYADALEKGSALEMETAAAVLETVAREQMQMTGLDHVGELNALRIQVDQLTAANDIMNTSNQDLTRALEEREDEIAQLEAEIAGLQGPTTAERQALDEVNAGKVQPLPYGTVAMGVEIKKLRAQIEELQAREVEWVKKSNSQIVAKEKAQTDLQISRDTRAELIQQLDLRQGEITELKAKLQEALNTPEKASKEIAGAWEDAVKDAIKAVAMDRKIEALQRLLDLLSPPTDIPF